MMHFLAYGHHVSQSWTLFVYSMFTCLFINMLLIFINLLLIFINRLICYSMFATYDMLKSFKINDWKPIDVSCNPHPRWFFSTIKTRLGLRNCSAEPWKIPKHPVVVYTSWWGWLNIIYRSWFMIWLVQKNQLMAFRVSLWLSSEYLQWPQ